MSKKKKASYTPATPTQTSESPWKKRFIWIAGAAVVLGLVAVVFLSQPELRGVPDGTQTVAVGSAQHVDGVLHDDGEVPAGGAHNEVWQNCGFYDQEVNSENAVHSLEHGAVWISYDPTLSHGDVATLRSFVSPSEKVIVSPVPGQGATIIVTAWANQLELDDPGDARLGQFVNEFSGASSAPEPGGRCSGGVGQPQF
jgi:hypothetical protein